MEAGVGYKNHSDKKSTSTIAAGVGFVPMLGVAITVETELNQKSMDNNSTNIPRPSL